MLHADSVEALAEGFEMYPATLRATFDAYQEACEAGEDAEFGKDAEHLVAYDDADGLYAIYLSPTSPSAISNESLHVLNTEDQPIENLFAVGECATLTLFGDYYVGSFSLGLYTAAGKALRRRPSLRSTRTNKITIMRHRQVGGASSVSTWRPYGPCDLCQSWRSIWGNSGGIFGLCLLH